MQNNQRQKFINFPWSEKIAFIITFYNEMQKKTYNKKHIAMFQAKIDELMGYEENQRNTQALIDLYDRIISAQKKTRDKELQKEQENLKQLQERIKKLKFQESSEIGNNPDEYLADQLAKIS